MFRKMLPRMLISLPLAACIFVEVLTSPSVVTPSLDRTSGPRRHIWAPVSSMARTLMVPLEAGGSTPLLS